MEISHISKGKLALYSSLSSPKMRERHGLFTAEGVKCVSDTLAHFDVEAILVSPEGIREVASLGCGDVPVYEVSRDEMKKISSLSTPSVIMAVYRIPADPEFEVRNDRLYLCLDGVRDPGNMGTIIRTAHWFGVDTIFASKDSVDIYNPKTVQSTMGSIAGVKVVYTDLETLFGKYPNLPTFGLMLEGEDIYKARLGKSGFIIMGNEGKGISEKLRTKISNPLLIPPAGENHGESLNVAVATAVTLALFARNEVAG